jgi:hypothetical protein
LRASAGAKVRAGTAAAASRDGDRALFCFGSNIETIPRA